MSASREKRSRQDVTPDAAAQTQQAPQKERSYGPLYAVIGVIVAVAAAAILVWNSNFFQNRAAAVTINGESYTAADVSYYYTGILQTQASYGMMGMTTFDYTVDPSQQIYDEATGQTWHDYILNQAVDTLTREVALATEAEKAGYTLSQAGQASVASAIADLDSSWISYGYANRDTFLRSNFGSGMSFAKYEQCLTRSAIASEYINAYAETYEYTDEQLLAHYESRHNSMDTFVLTQFLFQASVPVEYDDAGKAIERTEEENAALLEAAKAEAKANAEAVQARLEAGEDAQKLSEEFADQLYYGFVSETTLGSAVNTNYADWAYSDDRKSGDITLVEYPGSSGTVHNYCVARFEDRYLDQAETANIRHIFVASTSAPTEEEYAQALAQAEELLAQWKSEGATEDAFAQLAMDNSADTSSAANGGLLNVSTYDGYGQAFTDWALDPARTPGETGIVKNDFSTTKGYHIMYFVGVEEPYWAQIARSNLLTTDITDWQNGVMDAYTAEKGDGLKYVH